MTLTKEDIRKKAIEAVAKRIADQNAKNQPPPVPPAPPEPKLVPKPATKVPVGASDGGYLTVSPKATLTFGDHQEELLFTKASDDLTFKQFALGDRTDGQVDFEVAVTWQWPTIAENEGDATQKINGNGLAKFTVPFSVAKDKPDQPFTWQNAVPKAMESDGPGATFAVPHPPSSPTRRRRGMANFSPPLPFQEQIALSDSTAGDTISVNEGFSIAIVSASVQGTHDVGGGHQEQKQIAITKLKTFSFTARITLPDPTKPDPLPTAPPLVVLFKVNSDSTADDEDVIRDWYKGLDRRLRNSIESGKTPINLLGKASATGSEEYNRKLAHNRATKVKEILVDRASDQAKIIVQVIRKADAKEKGEKAEERVVEVTVGDDRPVTD